MNAEKLRKMAGVVRTGGKGSFRRKKKVSRKNNTTTDKRLQNTLKRIGVKGIPQIEEVNIFKDDIVIKFLNPKVQALIPANTWVVSGSPQTNTNSKEDNLSRIFNELGGDSLRKLIEELEISADLTATEKELIMQSLST